MNALARTPTHVVCVCTLRIMCAFAFAENRTPIHTHSNQHAHFIRFQILAWLFLAASDMMRPTLARILAFCALRALSSDARFVCPTNGNGGDDKDDEKLRARAPKSAKCARASIRGFHPVCADTRLYSTTQTHAHTWQPVQASMMAGRRRRCRHTATSSSHMNRTRSAHLTCTADCVRSLVVFVRVRSQVFAN